MPRSAVLAHWLLNERLNAFCVLGCVLCIVGSVTIVLHAPEEQPITSLLQVWRLAQQPGAGRPRGPVSLLFICKREHASAASTAALGSLASLAQRCLCTACWP